MNPVKRYCQSRDLLKRLEASRPRLYRMAYAWSRNPAVADDLTQEALAKALKGVRKLRDPKVLDTWLFSILTNCWRDYLRQRQQTEDIDNVTLLHESTPETEHDEQRLVNKVREAIYRLPVGQREVVTLVDLEGFTYSEVAKILVIPIGTVMSRLCRAHNALRTRLLRDFDQKAPAEGARFRRVK